ncbi:MAG TPA: sigma-70 family RNA polymerase sigma factor [Polyangia bacterium]
MSSEPPLPSSSLRLAPPEVDVEVDVGALYRAHAAAVARWARRFGGLQVDAEDIVQEVFLLAKRRLRHWEPGAKITTWLFRATEKIARRARRRLRLRSFFLSAFGLNVSRTTSPGPSALDRMISDDTCRRVYAVLDQLPERYRRVLILFEIEGLSTQQIADLVGVPQPTVRVWLFRARARFAELAPGLRSEEDTTKGTRP